MAARAHICPENVEICTYWIKRKQRRCSHRVADGNRDGLCSEHSLTGLDESRRLAEQTKIRSECCFVLKHVLDRVAPNNDENVEADGITKKRKRISRKKRTSAPKRMANPFSVDLSPDLGNIEVSQWFDMPHNPVHIDIGCARGRCMERLAARPERAAWNHLGVEIRPTVVQEAMERVNAQLEENALPGSSAGDKPRRNIHFLACNFVASADHILAAFPPGAVKAISIQFPDPWRRKKHLKRMLVQPQLVRLLARHLSSGAVIYLSSDCERVARWMRDRFMECVDEEGTAPGQPCFRLLDNVDHLVECGAVVEARQSPMADRSSNKLDNDHSIDQKSNLNPDVDTMEPASDELSDDEDDALPGEGQGKMDDREDEGEGADLYAHCWLPYNPLGELSERELVCEVDWRTVKRCVFERSATQPLNSIMSKPSPPSLVALNQLLQCSLIPS